MGIVDSRPAPAGAAAGCSRLRFGTGVNFVAPVDGALVKFIASLVTPVVNALVIQLISFLLSSVLSHSGSSNSSSVDSTEHTCSSTSPVPGAVSALPFDSHEA